MSGESDPGTAEGGGAPFRSIKRRRSQRTPMVWGTVVLVVLLAGAGVGYYFWAQEEDASPVDLPDTTQFEEPRDEPEEVEEVEEELEEPREELPELGASDAFVRDLAAELSENPDLLASWLAAEDLVHRFVGAVVDVSRGASPVGHLEHMEPDGGFRVRDEGDRFVIHPGQYERYNVIGYTVAALDVEGAAEVYRQLSPLFQEAYDELGLGEEAFDDVFARALGQLLAPEPPAPPVKVEPFDAGYEYSDERLAELSDAQKHLLRMGPDNMERVQAQLDALARELELEPVRP